MVFLRALAVPFFRWAAPVVEQAGAWTFRRTGGAIMARLWPFIRRGATGGVLGLSALKFAQHAAERDTAGEGIALQAQTAAWFHAAAEVATQLGYTIGNGSVATLRGFEHLAGVKIPRLVKARTGALAATLSGVAVGVRHGRKVRDRDWTTVTKWLRGLAATLAGLVAALNLILRHSGALTLPNPIALPRARAKTIDDEITAKFTRWLKKVRPAVWAGLIAAPVLWILTRRMPWAACRNVDKVGRRLCGMNGSLLDSLLLDTVLLAGAFSLVEFAEACQGFTNVVESGLKSGIRELRDVG